MLCRNQCLVILRIIWGFVIYCTLVWAGCFIGLIKVMGELYK